MIETRIYIGADNETGEVRWTTIRAWANTVLGDYTVYEARGVWACKSEPCAVLTHIGKPVSETHILELKDATKQDCILVTEAQVKVRMI